MGDFVDQGVGFGHVLCKLVQSKSSWAPQVCRPVTDVLVDTKGRRNGGRPKTSVANGSDLADSTVDNLSFVSKTPTVSRFDPEVVGCCNSIRGRSSVGQSAGLSRQRSWVQSPSSPP